MSNKILITESTKEAFIEEFEENFDEMPEEDIIAKAKKSKNFSVSFKENGEVQIKQVLLG